MKNTPEPNKPVLAYNGEYPHIAYYNSGRWHEVHTHELLEGITHWDEMPELKQ